MAGDFNGDGRTDLAVANLLHYRLRRVGVAGQRRRHLPEPGDVRGGDIPKRPRGGGLQRRRPHRPGRRQLLSNDVSVLLGNGDGTFQNQVRYAAGSGPSAIVAGDFNGDGRTDLATANFCDSNDVSVLLGNGDGTFQSQVPYAAGSRANRPRGGGLQRRRPDRPGRRQPRLRRRVGVAGQRRRHLPEPGAVRGGDRARRPRGGGLQRRRSDRPGRRQPASNDVSVLLGNGDGTFQSQVRYAVGTGPSALVAGDFNGDGRTDLAVANYGSNDVSVLLGNGDGTFQNQVRYAVGSSPSSIVAGDFNGDGRTDLAVANSRLQRRVGVAGQRRRHLPEPGAVRGGDLAILPRGGGLQRRRPHRPRRRQLQLQPTCRCC